MLREPSGRPRGHRGWGGSGQIREARRVDRLVGVVLRHNNNRRVQKKESAREKHRVEKTLWVDLCRCVYNRWFVVAPLSPTRPGVATRLVYCIPAVVAYVVCMYRIRAHLFATIGMYVRSKSMPFRNNR